MPARKTFPVDAMGQRLKSDSDVVMFEDSPGSENRRTLPAGKPSPLIVGYIPSGYWQLETPEKQILYVKDIPAVSVVPPDTPDGSAIFAGVFNSIYDFFGNTSRDVVKTSGFLKEGFETATGDLKKDFFSFSGEARKILYAVGGVLLLWLLIKLND